MDNKRQTESPDRRQLLRTAIDESVLCWLATVDAEGRPNVSPKEVFTLQDEQTLLIAHIASPASVRNIACNEQVCVSMINVFTQKGVKLSGQALVVTDASHEYAGLLEQLQPLAGDFTIRGIMRIRIERVVPIIAPSYWLKPGTTERDQAQNAYRQYGVSPAVL